MYLTQGIYRSLQHTPGHPATIFGNRVRSFAEQADRVSRLAGALRSLGVSDGERVAILALNSDRYLELFLAVPWANGIVNTVNTRWNPNEIAYALCDSDSSILVVDDTFAPVVPELIDRHPGLRAVIHAGDSVRRATGPAPEGVLAYEDLVTAATPISDARRGGDAVAGVLYTGGTTGHPKGVVLTHANLLTSALGGLASLPLVRPRGRVLHAAPMFHMTGLHTWLIQSIVGGTQIVVPRFDPVGVMAATQEHLVTDMLLVPTMIHAVIDHPEREAYDLTSLTRIQYGGSPISQALLDRAMEALPHAEFVQVYGMTELGLITVLDGDDHRRGDRLGSAGHVMSGYWGKPDETAAVLRDGWLLTGDGAYMDEDGYVFIVDRIKDMIITGGENVYSAEVEQALGRHPAVATCAVIGVHDERWGERVHAVVVPNPGADATPADLQEHIRRLIAGYKVPRTIELVDTLPLSGAGKVLKRELRARHADADPAHGAGGVGQARELGTRPYGCRWTRGLG